MRHVLTDEQIAIERAVLGAVISGSLGLRDLHDLPLDAWIAGHHADIALVLEVMLETRARDPRLVPGRTGLPLDRVLAICDGAGVWPAGKMMTIERRGRREPYALGYLPTLARSAPRRPEALRAKNALIEAAHARVEADLERQRTRRSLAELVPASLLALSPEERAAVIDEAASWRTRRAG